MEQSSIFNKLRVPPFSDVPPAYVEHQKRRNANVQSMTLREYHNFRFYRLLDLYREAKKARDTPEGRQAFLPLSLRIHVAKAHVPKRLWPLVNKP